MAHLQDPEYITSIQNHRQSVNWISFSPNSKYLASASGDQTLNVYSLDECGLFHKFEGHKDIVTSVSLSENFMVSGSKDRTARLWKLDTFEDGYKSHKESLIYRNHSGTIRSVDISLDERLICTASDDKTVCLWSTVNNRSLGTLSKNHDNWVRCAKFFRADASNLLASCGDDGLINIWDLRGKDVFLRLSLTKRRSTHFTSLQWHPLNGNFIASSSTDSYARIWDIRTNDPIQSYQVHNGTVTSVDFHESCKYLLTSSVDSSWKIIDIYEGMSCFTGRTGSAKISCSQFSPDGLLFATAGKEISLWKSMLPTSDGFINDEDQVSVLDMPEIECNDPSDPIHETVHIKDNAKESDYGLNTLKEDEQICLSPNIPSELSPNCDCIQFLQNILSQISSVTDSILDLDKRLGNIEKRLSKVEKRL